MTDININIRHEFGEAAELMFKAIAFTLTKCAKPAQSDNPNAATKKIFEQNSPVETRADKGPEPDAEASSSAPDVPADVFSLNLPAVERETLPQDFSEAPAALAGDVVEIPVVWTPERIQALATMKALGETWYNIHVALNKTAGKPIASGDACAAKYYALLKSGGLPLVSRALEVAPVPVPLVQLPEPPAEPKKPAPVAEKVWTRARDQALSNMREAKKDWPEILVVLNRLPGTSIITEHAIQVHYWKLRKNGTLPKPVSLKDIEKAAAPTPVPISGQKDVERMTLPEARQWAAGRGLCNGYDGAFNLAEVNAKRTHLGLAQIELVRR
jgi:hypothetical protein